jgi:hypothetical protein
MQAAAGLAERAADGGATEAERVRRIHVFAYGRSPTETELTAAGAFLAAAERSLAAHEPDADQRRREAWSALCHAILAANEFIYLQ